MTAALALAPEWDWTLACSAPNSSLARSIAICSATAPCSPPPRVALGVLLGQHRPLRLEHRARHEVLTGDHLEGALLAGQLAVEDLGDIGVQLGDGLIEDVHGASCGADKGGTAGGPLSSHP